MHEAFAYVHGFGALGKNVGLQAELSGTVKRSFPHIYQHPGRGVVAENIDHFHCDGVSVGAFAIALDADYFRRGKSSERPSAFFLRFSFGESEKPAKASPSVASPSA